MVAEPSTRQARSPERVCCPSCGAKGRPVGVVTVRAWVKEAFAKALLGEAGSRCDARAGCGGVAEGTGWRFCASPSCDVVYFSEEKHPAVFTKSQLIGPVGIKEQTGERPLCYCFDHSIETIKEEIRTKGYSSAVEDIRTKMKTIGCDCVVRNPSGTCCLRTVASGIRVAMGELTARSNRVRPRVPTRLRCGVARSVSPGPTRAPRRLDKGTCLRGTILASVGAMVTALLASACCWLPLVVAALGLSAARAGTWFESYRPYFLLTAFTLLLSAWYTTYRHGLQRLWARLVQKGVPRAEDACCSHPDPEALVDELSPCAGVGREAGHCCNTGPTATSGAGTSGHCRVTMARQMLLWVATGATLCFALFPQWVGLAFRGMDNSPNGTRSSAQYRVVLSVEGMSCEGCALAVREAIRGVPGVLNVSVHLDRSEATVVLAMRQKATFDNILDAVRKAGYEANVKSFEPVRHNP